MRIPFIAGNWKMYKSIAEAKEYAMKFKTLYSDKESEYKLLLEGHLQIPNL